MPARLNPAYDKGEKTMGRYVQISRSSIDGDVLILAGNATVHSPRLQEVFEKAHVDRGLVVGERMSITLKQARKLMGNMGQEIGAEAKKIQREAQEKTKK